MEDRRAKHAAELEAKRKKLEEIRRRKANIRDEASDVGQDDNTTNATQAEQQQQQEPKFDDFIQNIIKATTEETQQQQQEAVAKAVTISLAEKLAGLSTMNNVAEIHIQPTLVETYTKHTQSDITLEHDLIVREDGTSSSMDIDDPTNATGGDGGLTILKSPVAVGSKRKFTEEDNDSNRTRSTPMTVEEKKKILESEALENFLIKSSRIVERVLANGSEYDFMIDYSAIVEDYRHGGDETSANGLGGETLKLQMIFKDDKWTQFRAVTDIDVSPFHTELMMVSYTGRDFLEEEEQSRKLAANHSTNGQNKQQQWDSIEGSSKTSSVSHMTDIASVTEGVVLLWSTALPTRPEYKFTCHSQVTASCFHPFDRHIIFGGTYSGQVVMWDMRAKSAPVQKSSMAAMSHTHPIYSMAVVGTKSTHTLVSASTDGRVCIWHVDQLQQPIDVLDLRISLSIISNYSSSSSVSMATDKKIEASVTSFAVSKKENKQLFIGTEAGKLFTTKLDGSTPNTQKSSAASGAGTTSTTTSSKENVDPTTSNSISSSVAGGTVKEIIVTSHGKDGSHFGPVTAMHFNPVIPSHRDGLLLTCSLDSTVKLWSAEYAEAPLFSFEPSTEYICDVRWSPIHPAVFAVVDGNGMVYIWNICKDLEVPALEVKVSKKAINKIRWSQDGTKVLIGDAHGNLYVYDVPSQVAIPHAEDLALLESKVASAIAANSFK